MKVETLLREEIQNEFNQLSKMELGTEQYEKTVNGLAKLMDKAIEIEKFNVECEEKSKEYDLKCTQSEEDKKDRLIKNIIAGAGVAIPSILTVWGTIKSIKFEQEGTITTIMGRGFINKLLPKK